MREPKVEGSPVEEKMGAATRKKRVASVAKVGGVSLASVAVLLGLAWQLWDWTDNRVKAACEELVRKERYLSDREGDRELLRQLEKRLDQQFQTQEKQLDRIEEKLDALLVPRELGLASEKEGVESDVAFQ